MDTAKGNPHSRNFCNVKNSGMGITFGGLKYKGHAKISEAASSLRQNASLVGGELGPEGIDGVETALFTDLVVEGDF